MENRYTAAVITVSDKGFAGLREDTSCLLYTSPSPRDCS